MTVGKTLATDKIVIVIRKITNHQQLYNPIHQINPRTPC